MRNPFRLTYEEVCSKKVRFITRLYYYLFAKIYNKIKYGGDAVPISFNKIFFWEILK